MKKTMKKRALFGLLVALVVCGCQLKEEGEFAPEGKVFTATMEAMVDDAPDIGTKTSMDANGNVRWKRGDQVSIFVGSTINQHFQVTDASDGKTAAALNQVESPGFVAGSEIVNNVAFYPYAATAEIAKSGNSYIISDIALPATQYYANASFGNGSFPMTAVTSSTSDYNLKFKNVLGGLKLQLKGTATITSISVTGNNNEKLCGAAEVTVSGDNAPAITLTEASAKTATLDCGDGVQLDANTATAFIIALPPVTMSVGFTVTVTDTENKQMEIKTTKSQTITRSSLLAMPEVTYAGIWAEPSTDDPYLEISSHEANVDEFGGEVTVMVSANYEYTVDCDAEWITIKQTGETFICSVAPNEKDSDRYARLIFSSEGLVAYLNISQLAHGSNVDPFDVGSNLSANGTANCYIVPKAGKYSFDASVMGNGPQGFLWTDDEAAEQFLWPTEQVPVSFSNYGSEKPNQASVLWDDNNVITDVSIDSDLQVSFTATGNKGNAVIIVKNKQMELLWSWHIWCTDSPARHQHESVDGTRIVMLDRNLGATSANPADGEATFGYWYQFGRKDPLKLYYNVAYSMAEGEQSMQASVTHPSTIFKFVGKDQEWFNGSIKTITADLWGNPYALHNGSDHMYSATLSELRKTIYDPCPPGYMVPPEWAWDSFNMDDCTVSDYGLTFSVGNGDAFYPFAGFGDQGDEYGGDNGWYGYPGYVPNSDGQKYHHNMRNVVCCWSSGSEHAYLRSGYQWDINNYHHANQFVYMQNEETSGNTVRVNENSQGYLYNKYGHIRHRCCSVRCMKIPE